MDCQRCVNRLSDYIDGALGARKLAQIRTHLASCAYCRQEHEALLRLRASLRALPDVPARSDFWPHIHHFVRARVRQRAARTEGQQPARYLPFQARLAASAVPRTALTCMAGISLVLLARTLPMLWYTPDSPSLPRITILRPVGGWGPKTDPYAPDVISVDSLIAIHAGHSTMLPLSDAGRMRFLSSESVRADLRQDGMQDIR